MERFGGVLPGWAALFGRIFVRRFFDNWIERKRNVGGGFRRTVSGRFQAFSGLFRKRFDGHVLDGKYRRLGLGLIGDEFPTIPSDMTVKVEFST